MKIASQRSLLIVGLAVVTGVVAVKAVEAATELAKINNQVITLEDFNKRYQENLKFFQANTPTKKGVLDDLIKRELAIQEAKKMGLDKDPEVIDRMNTVLYHALLDKKLSKDFDAIHVSDDEAKAFYAKNPEVRTSHIFVAVAPGAKPDEVAKAKARIQKIYDEHVRPGKEGFPEIAQHWSEGPAAQMGGDIGYQTKDKLDPKYYEEAVALRSPGKVSGIVRSQFGFHIIKLTAVRAWEDTDRPLVKRLVVEKRREEIFDRYMGQLRNQARVSVHPELLKD